jgi:hypothetical protein
MLIVVIVLLALGVLASILAIIWDKPVRLDVDPDGTPVIVGPPMTWGRHKTTVAIVAALLFNTGASVLSLFMAMPE